jgi:hypothetical protein
LAGKQSRQRGGLDSDAGDYWSLSAKPLHSLVFLIPLVLLYELGALLYLTDPSAGIQQTIRAKKVLDLFFQSMGVVGLLVSGLAMLLVLFIMHLLARDKWTIKPAVLLGMALEAALWALPLVVLGTLVQRAGAMLAPAAVAMDPAQNGTAAMLALPWQARLTISLGAGIYEELLFRLIAIATIHLIVRDLLRFSEPIARAAAIVGSALLFAVYHDVTLPGSGGGLGGLAGVQWGPALFYFAAGLFFGVIYVARGLGIVVATHAFYDVIALIVLPAMHRG